MLIIDAHEDIAWNMLTFNRDYTQPVRDIRQREANTEIPERNGHTLLGLDAWRAGKVGVVFSTLFASPIERQLGAWDILSYRNPQEAYQMAGRMLDTYLRLADEHDSFQAIATQSDLKQIVSSWDDNRAGIVGLIPLMEGADPIIEPSQVEEWYERGVRIVGPAWSATRYAGGTGAPGPLTLQGFELLGIMGGLNMLLDLSHLAEEAYFQAMETYNGPIMASHANPRRFFPDTLQDRGLSDDMIRLLAERDGVIGVVLFNRFLNPKWHRTDQKDTVSLEIVVDAIDHICQVTGSAHHAGIGTDFDGGFGYELTPAEINTVADLRKLIPLLETRGYSQPDIEELMHGNWLRLLGQSLPE